VTTTASVQRRALVTGAASGIGAALVRRLEADGWAVVAWDLKASQRTTSVDVTISDDVRDAAETLPDLDLVINSAGVGSREPAAELTCSDWDRVLATNLSGAFYVSHYLLPKLAPRHGVLVHIGSIAAHVGFRDRSVYSASKAGVLALARSLGIEWAEPGVRVFSVSPTFTDSPMAREGFETGKTSLDQVIAHTPQARLLDVDELATAIVRLCDPAFAAITGSDVRLDCGFTALSGF
jgi:NAD(P)-dependent dehydrogenase (short-subunit alcohol dehydrogenase family)